MKVYEPSERLNYVLLTYEIKNLRSLAKEIGLAGPEMLYQINRGRARISPNLAQLINKRFPAVDYLFLLSGVKPEPLAIKIPIYLTDAVNRFKMKSAPDNYAFIPFDHTKGVDFALVNTEPEPISGVSEHNLILVGEIVKPIITLKGKPYLIHTKDFTLLRYITYEKSVGKYRLSSNIRLSIHDTFLDEKEVLDIYAVRYVLQTY